MFEGFILQDNNHLQLQKQIDEAVHQHYKNQQVIQQYNSDFKFTKSHTDQQEATKQNK